MKASEKTETFIDCFSNSFGEYISSVVNKLRDTDSEYRDIEECITKLYEDYPSIKQGNRMKNKKKYVIIDQRELVSNEKIL